MINIRTLDASFYIASFGLPCAGICLFHSERLVQTYKQLPAWSPLVTSNNFQVTRKGNLFCKLEGTWFFVSVKMVNQNIP